jgi:type II secretory pathway pseudopilin PulG
MSDKSPQSQRGYTILQGLAILAVIGIVATIVLNYLR